ncbi:MAG TPA: hypothetical protein VKR06_36060 [Ktedonosporobacter sp.]|nr:hypothetical protein [Ktedonosporobacter sp.]
MKTIVLLDTTGNERVDHLLREIIIGYEIAFPERMRGYYIEGSYADHSNVTTSDVDLIALFNGDFVSDEECEKAEEMARRFVDESEIELDIEVMKEQGLGDGLWPTFKMGSLLLYGEDIRDRYPLLPLDVWTRDRMHSSLWRTVNLCNRPAVLSYPLDYPDPVGEFYGYDRRKVRLADGDEVNCTRDLIRLTGWSATAILAFKAGKYVARKSDCHKIYQACFDDEWGQLLENIYVLCRGKWNYLIPSEQGEQSKLREICQRTLGFENHFLQIYKEFVLSDLRNSYSQSVLQTLNVMKCFVYRDKEIEAAVRALAEDEDDEVRSVARAMLGKFAG